MERLVIFQQLGIALALGLLIGTERGWHERAAPEGGRVAGIRTFGLAGLLGGLIGLASLKLTVAFAGLAFVGFAGLVIVGYWQAVRNDADQLGMTTEVALLMTFTLGLLSTLGYPLIAAASAVIVTILLGLKPVLHAWLTRLSAGELNAALKFLLISVVMLPLLPNQGYGPWSALNPHLAWWMVVLVSGLSFMGYLSIKLAGSRRGIMLSSLLGGLVSSTAMTLSLSRYAREGRYSSNLLAAGILAASSIMFPRVLIEAAAINPTLIPALAPPMLAMALVMLAVAVYFWRRVPNEESIHQTNLPNPFELGSALKFGLLLAVIMIMATGAEKTFGNSGLYALALAAGLADVDAITLSVAKMSLQGLESDVARNAILIAAFTNSAVKFMLALFIGGWSLGMRTGITTMAAITLGVSTLFV
ncbi:MAG: MgtC/SapB family protein [Halothiobacillaceae bacterium]|nr:MAG: MgtC/SapB family protein [Halothiobacillaceae bacterium]